MSSRSLLRWQTSRLAALDEIEQAHRAVGGAGRGRRYATLQINHAYAVLLSSQFQGFCRDLHTEAADLVAAAVSPPIQSVVRQRLLAGRKLDTGNANSGNLGADFGHFGLELWPALYRVDRRNRKRKAALDALSGWRNAIAHQDFTKVGSATLSLAAVRAWRRHCDVLASQLDRTVGTFLTSLVGRKPW